MIRGGKILLAALCAVFFLPAPARAQDITTGLIGHWTLDETSGTNLNDSSSGNNDGTWGGSANVNPVTGARGNAQNFDNTGEYIDMGDINAMDGLTQITVAAWVKSRVPDANTGETQVVDKSSCNGVGGGGPWELMFGGFASQVATFVIYPADMTPGAYLYSDQGSTNVDDGNWHFLVGRYDGLNIEIWVDGELENSEYYPGETMTSTGNRVMVGGYCENYNLGYIIDGDVDDVRVYNRALDAADILYLYNNTHPGKIRYNANWRVPEYLATSTRWVAMGPTRYAPQGVSFYESYNAVNARLSRTSNISGTVDSKLLTGSFWFRRSIVSQGTRQMVWVTNSTNTGNDGNSRFRIEFAADNTLQFIGKFDGATTILDVKTSTAFTDTNWHHVMFSFDMANTANRYIYIDGASSMAVPATYTDSTIDFSTGTPRHSVGARHAGALPFFGELADFWFDIDRYTDFSQAANRSKFYNGGPVYLGPTGNLPFNAAPDVYLTIEDDDDVFQDNEGTGGAFTLTNNLTDSFSRPGLTPNTLPQTYAIGPGGIAAGDSHGCGVRTDGIGLCWGYVISWGTGHGSATQFHSPTALYGNARWRQIISFGEASCGIMDDNEIYCWGSAYGNSRMYPDSINEPGPWRMINGKDYTICAVKYDNTGWCWGENDYGQVGDGATTDLTLWEMARIPGQWQMITSGWRHSCGIKTDGTAWCWGDRTYGNIGDGGSLVGNQLTPLQVGSDTWQSIDAGGAITCGIKTDGSGWCWGDRTDGKIGDGGASAGTQNTPVQISGAGPWAMISAGEGEHACGIKADGTGWCWGADDFGQLGDSGGDDTSNVPLAISGGGTWAAISVNDDHSCGIKSDHTGYCWGEDGTEQRLGNGATNTDQFTPAAIAGGHSWSFGEPQTGCLNPDRKTGAIAYNADEDVPQFCNGEDWIAMGPVPGAGGAGCSNPARDTGTILYASDRHLVQYCDGADWIQVGHQAIIPTLGLVSHWALDETSGSSIADSSGNGHTGTWTEPGADSVAQETVPGKQGTALAFATDKYITRAGFVMPDSGTFSAWVTTNFTESSVASGAHPILFDTSTPRTTFSYDTGTERYTLRTDEVGDQAIYVPNSDITGWFHIAVTWSNSGSQIYLNGAPVGTAGSGDDTSNSPSNLWIGQRNQQDREWDGNIDDVRIYSRALSPDEVLDLYYATGGN